MTFYLDIALWIASLSAIALNVFVIRERYLKNKAERIKYGAPLSFWHSIRGRGFWRDGQGGWVNE